MTYKTFLAPVAAVALSVSGITALTLGVSNVITAPSANADTLWRDPVNYNTLGGSGTYNTGDYTELRQNDINRNSLYESTIQDRDGNYYDCNSIGSCNSRY